MADDRPTPVVFLVDRTPQWLDFGQSTLRQAGYTVRTAPDLETLLSRGITRDSLVLVDASLAQPKLENARSMIRSITALGAKLVLMLATTVKAADLGLAFSLGAQDCVDKQYSAPGLLQAVGVLSSDLPHSKSRID